MKYFDKNGNEILEGMRIKHYDGKPELVYKSDDGDLGINASNENHKGFSEFSRELYPLYQFNLNEWEIVVDDKRVIFDIVKRADEMNLLLFDRLSLVMDIENTHKETELRLVDLLNADDLNFIHDIVGIQNNMNRETGKLENFFLPRYAKNQAV